MRSDEGHADSQMTQIFLLCCLFVPQISQNSTDFCPMRAGISQMLQISCCFLGGFEEKA